MEVCGTHTMAIFRYGIKKMLPENIRLLSGPGCPVCVTPNKLIDTAISYARHKEVILCIFGDMLRVPGSSSSLEKEKALGRDIRILYSAMDALEIALNNPLKKVVFLAIGFETTSPTIASTVQMAKEKNIKNFYLLTGHKIIPPAMEALVNTKDLRVDGFICPGHVSTIIGSIPYKPIASKYSAPCVISGFEPLDILQSIYMLCKQVKSKEAKVEIQYKRVVKEEGNKLALEMINKVFKVEDSNWRGIGVIPGSGHNLNEDYKDFDILENLTIEVEDTKEKKGCICGLILQGLKTPLDCDLFKKVCKPENPIGACMVSSEGTCAAYYKYGGY
jgi:hydrogenase expression/formation protein HypD